jgi:hypothetical protein
MVKTSSVITIYNFVQNSVWQRSVLRRCWLRISAETPAILSEVVPPNIDTVDRSGDDRFLSNPLQFITDLALHSIDIDLEKKFEWGCVRNPGVHSPAGRVIPLRLTNPDVELCGRRKSRSAQHGFLVITFLD